MEISIKNNGELGRKVHITLPASIVRKSFNKYLRETSKKIRLPGFRSGKVPAKLIEELHGEKIYEDVTEELIEKAYRDAVEEKKLKPVGAPDIKKVNTTLGEDFEIVASIEVMPEFTPAMLENESLEKPVAEVTDTDVADFLMKIRRDRGTWEGVDRSTQKGDKVSLRVHEGDLNKLFGKKEGENIEMIVGEVPLEGDFNETLLGINLQDKVTVHAKVAASEQKGRFSKLLRKVKLQKEYVMESSQVTLEEIKEPKLAELDKDFFAYFGMKKVDVDELNKTLREGMEQRLEKTLKDMTDQNILDKLVEKNSFNLPQTLVKNEIAYLRDRLVQSMHLDEEKQKLIEDNQFRVRAEYNVRSFLVIDKIAEQHKVEVDNKTFEKKLHEVTSPYQAEERENLKRHYRRDAQARHSIQVMVLQDKVLELVSGKVKFNDKKHPTQDIIGFAKPAFM